VLAHRGERTRLLVAGTLRQANENILAFLTLFLIGSAFDWAKKAHDYASTAFNYQMTLLGLDWMPKRRETTKYTNETELGSLQAVFRCHISHAKGSMILISFHKGKP